MKILGGKHAGFTIRPPKNLAARPTTALAKESLFNILNNKIDFEEATVIDLFAGAGNISFEFASRGAKSVTAIDISPVSVNFIKTTAKEMGLANLQILKGDALRYLEKTAQPVDFIFADPPYAMQNIARINELVFEKGWLNVGGMLVIEHEVRVLAGGVNFVEQRKYGQSAFSFYSNC